VRSLRSFSYLIAVRYFPQHGGDYYIFAMKQ